GARARRSCIAPGEDRSWAERRRKSAGRSCTLLHRTLYGDGRSVARGSGSSAQSSRDCTMIEERVPAGAKRPRRRSDYLALLGALLALTVLVSYANGWLL